MQFSELVDHFGLPAHARDQPQPRLASPHPLLGNVGRLRGALRRRRRGRRLAYLDNTFPWQRSGFRYHEAEAIHALLPDTLFFSTWKLVDPFPTRVHALADFARIAPAAGITDAYGVFQLFLEGICGLHEPTDPPEAFAGLDLSAVLARERIHLHGSIYPGGGFVPTPDGLRRTRLLSEALDTTFSYVPEVLAEVPKVTPVAQAFTATHYYTPTSERWQHPAPFTCLFAADAPPRKGFDVALAAFRELDPDRFHLHVVGPHQHRRSELPDRIATFHGWLAPAQLRDLHRVVHAFVSPVSAEPPGPDGSFQGVVDGFPTQAAADALSSGCLLISANPLDDHRVIEAGEHYIRCEPDPALLRAAIEAAAANLDATRQIAEAGSARVRERTDVRRGAAEKLTLMGFDVAKPS